MTEEDKIDAILEHIEHVQANCKKVGRKLIRLGKAKLGRDLIRHGLIHDRSKLSGIEFAHLWAGDPLLSVAVHHHQTTNKHHPEYWDSIHEMPEEFIAEMVCDCCGRGSEMLTDTRTWFREVATQKYGFNMKDEVGRKIEYYLDLLATPVFKQT